MSARSHRAAPWIWAALLLIGVGLVTFLLLRAPRVSSPCSTSSAEEISVPATPDARPEQAIGEAQSVTSQLETPFSGTEAPTAGPAAARWLRIAGVVLDRANGEPVSGADIELEARNVATQSRPDGSFTLTATLSRFDATNTEWYGLYISAEGYVARGVVCRAQPMELTTLGDIRLYPCAVVDVVPEVQGSSSQSADVLVGWKPEAAVEGDLAADTLRAVPNEPVTLCVPAGTLASVYASAPRYRSATSSPFLLERDERRELVLRLEPLGREDTITGRVQLPDAAAYEDVLVRVAIPSAHPAKGKATIDEEGDFAWEVWEDISADEALSLWAEDTSNTHEPGPPIRARPGEQNLVLSLGPLRPTVTVVAEDATGKLVERFETRVWAPPVVMTFDGTSGSATVAIPPGPCEISVGAEGYLNETVGPRTFEPGEEITVTLKRRPAIEGQVLDPSGKGVPGTAVKIMKLVSPKRQLLLEGWPSELYSGVHAATTTDEAGKFRMFMTGRAFDGILRAESRSYAPCVSAPMHLDGAAGRDGIRLQFEGIGGTIQGRVLDYTGRPVAHATVQASCGDGVILARISHQLS